MALYGRRSGGVASISRQNFVLDGYTFRGSFSVVNWPTNQIVTQHKIGKNLRDEGLSYDFQCSFKRPLHVGNLSVKIREVKIRALQ